MSLYSNIPSAPPGAPEFLSSLPLFADLTGDQLDQIAQRVQRRTYAYGITLFHQDMPGTMMYMIESGSVRVISIGRTGQELTLNVLGPGELFGELSLLDGQQRSATAITLAPTVAWLLSQADLKEFMHKFPPVNQAMIQILVERVRSTARRLEAMTFQDVLGRLAFELLSLAERSGKPCDRGVEITIPLTQVDLATMVGATRESVNKSVSILRSKGLIDFDGTSWFLQDPAGMQQILYERGR
ncbi:MAG: Crp/Fnr family transcriptional regulator [Anaerolineales bacterium]|nr:Crp/Fnr family transcriptional regulator [Anaerolineales bacterium]